MKKARVSFWIDTCEIERLTELSRKNGLLISDYVKEAIADLMKKYNEPRLRLIKNDNDEENEKNAAESRVSRDKRIGGG